LPDNEEEVGFADFVVVSTEDLSPQPGEDICYTLWTDAHEENRLIVDGIRGKYQDHFKPRANS